MNETKSIPPTPEQLVQMLEIEIQGQRSKRQRGAHTRTAFRVGAIVLIVGGLALALLVLQFAMSEMPHPQRTARPGSALTEVP